MTGMPFSGILTDWLLLEDSSVPPDPRVSYGGTRHQLFFLKYNPSPAPRAAPGLTAVPELPEWCIAQTSRELTWR